MRGGRRRVWTAALLVAASCILAAARLPAQPAGDAQALRALGQEAATRGDDAAAVAHWARAAEILTAAQDWSGLGDLHVQRGLDAFGRRDEVAAERWWLDAVAAFEAAGNTRSRGRVLRNLSFLRRLPLEHRVILARQSVELAAGDARTEGVARHHLSDLLYLDGDMAGAFAELDVALPLLEAAGDERVFARALTSQGRLLRLFGRAADSVRLNHRAAALLEAAGDLSGAAQALDAATRAHLELGDDAALATSEAALATARRGSRPDLLALTLCRRASVLAIHGRTAEGLPLLDEGLVTAGDGPTQNQCLQASASVQERRGRPEAALAALEARAVARLPSEDLVWHHNDRARQLSALGRRGEARAALKEAVAAFDAIAPRLLPEDGSKRAYYERTARLVDLHVSLLAALEEPEAALVASERGRARAFLDLMATRGDAGGTPARLAEASGLAPAIPVDTPTAGRPSPSPRQLQVGDLLTRAGASTTAPATAAQPRVASSRAVPAPSLAAMKRVAATQGSHILSYWVDDAETLAWVIAPDGAVSMHRLAIGAPALSALAGATLASSAGPVRGEGQVGFDAGSRRAFNRLYDVLIAPLRQALPRERESLLTIVPHGPLFRVSFAALQDRRGRYLVEDFRLHYAPSIGTLALLPPRRAFSGPVVVVADPELAPRPDGTVLPRLPAAAREGRAIARVLTPRVVDVLAGRDATEARLRSRLPGASVVHFATHGIVSDTDPWASYLALGRSGDASAVDGVLGAGELYDLNLNAGMVVLGACRTATGPLTGDGITGLARGFFAAGVPVVVASLWDLPDVTTARLQPRFYREWQRSHSAAQALRAAQLGLLADLRAGRVTADTPAGAFAVPEHPSVWAGLVVLGAP